MAEIDYDRFVSCARALLADEDTFPDYNRAIAELVETALDITNEQAWRLLQMPEINHGAVFASVSSAIYKVCQDRGLAGDPEIMATVNQMAHQVLLDLDLELRLQSGDQEKPSEVLARVEEQLDSMEGYSDEIIDDYDVIQKARRVLAEWFAVEHGCNKAGGFCGRCGESSEKIIDAFEINHVGFRGVSAGQSGTDEGTNGLPPNWAPDSISARVFGAIYRGADQGGFNLNDRTVLAIMEEIGAEGISYRRTLRGPTPFGDASVTTEDVQWAHRTYDTAENRERIRQINEERRQRVKDRRELRRRDEPGDRVGLQQDPFFAIKGSRFDTEGEGWEIVGRMNQIIHQYGHVTVQDLLDLLGLESYYVPSEYRVMGWTGNIPSAAVRLVETGEDETLDVPQWHLDLPTPGIRVIDGSTEKVQEVFTSGR
jgi:hypothetical protein